MNDRFEGQGSTWKQKLISLASRRGSWSIILIYNLITVSIIAAFYPVIPSLLNYPPNNEEVSTRLGTSNIAQYIAITVITVILGTLILLWFFRGIDKWRTLDIRSPQNAKRIAQIRVKCLNLPSFIFLLQILIMMIPLAALLFYVATVNRITYLAPAKIVLMVTSFFSLAAVITHTFAKEIFKKILSKTYTDEEQQGMRLSLRRKIFLQMLPLVVIAILYTSLIGYSRLIEEKGDLIYDIFSSQLEVMKEKSPDIGSFDDAFQILKDIHLNDTKYYFVARSPQGVIKTTDNAYLGGYLTYFLDNPYQNNRLFDINAEIQGVITEIPAADGVWKLGVVFHVASDRAVAFFVTGFLIILTMNVFVLSVFTKSLSKDISQVADSLMDIADGEYVNLEQHIPVTSNDEIGSLVVAFNRILDREKTHLKNIEEQHEVMMEQERLASLGHLMGGIAHNMRTPIMSISGGIEGLRDLIQEYENAIGDSEVTLEDHREIAAEMRDWVDKMKSHCGYMSDIITAIRGQTMHGSEDRYLSFSLQELEKRLEVLMAHEIKKRHCELNIDFEKCQDKRIQGELSAMVQVLSNLILNAAEAYEGSGGKIGLSAALTGTQLLLAVSDEAGGISENIKERLFKEMVTTKGKNGTGLGLYMSVSKIKAQFGGKMWFESTLGEGSTFYVQIPVAENLREMPPTVMS